MLTTRFEVSRLQASGFYFGVSKLNLKNYFPQGVAKGRAFIGRTLEAKDLAYNIRSGHHTLLMASRRFGKTSLAKNVLSKLKLPYGEANFYLAQTEKSVQFKILDAICEVIEKTGSKSNDVISKLTGYFRGSKKTWNIGIKGLFGVEIVPQSHDDIPDNILFALQCLEKLLIDHKKMAVIYLDEIQELCELDNGFALQGAIREFAQHSKQLVFIFSGSNRRLLSHMFDDKAMPLYELCERIHLKPISVENYNKYLNKVAKETFGEPLEKEVLETIYLLTCRHPKRMYNLCYRLWQRAESKKFSVKFVQLRWEELVESRANEIRKQLKSISAGQLKVLTFIAIYGGERLTRKEVQLQTTLASSSIVKALESLEENDLVVRLSNEYHIVDPVLKEVLKRYEAYNLIESP